MYNIDDASMNPFWETKKIGNVVIKEANEALFIKYLKKEDDEGISI